YPVLQAADILAYKANAVPVGRDQLPHLELTREIVRRFNNLYGRVFAEPEALLSEAPVVVGLDGRKMSKSYNNTILLSDPPEVIRAKVRSMFTDPMKIYKTDPGHPESCPVYRLHLLYNKEESARVLSECSLGHLGCVQDKQDLAESIIRALSPIQNRRRELEGDPQYTKRVLSDGAARARETAEATMREVRSALGFAEMSLSLVREG
ncbi:MAG: tryptophan--tRNA ligase, partial [Armatimonadota bacterium]